MYKKNKVSWKCICEKYRKRKEVEEHVKSIERIEEQIEGREGQRRVRK